MRDRLFVAMIELVVLYLVGTLLVLFLLRSGHVIRAFVEHPVAHADVAGGVR